MASRTSVLRSSVLTRFRRFSNFRSDPIPMARLLGFRVFRFLTSFGPSVFTLSKKISKIKEMALAYGFLESEVDSNKNFEDQFRIFNLPDPTTDDQPVTKGYADTHYSRGGGGLSASGFTMQGKKHNDSISSRF